MDYDCEGCRDYYISRAVLSTAETMGQNNISATGQQAPNATIATKTPQSKKAGAFDTKTFSQLHPLI